VPAAAAPYRASGLALCRNSEIVATRSRKRSPSPAIYFKRVPSARRQNDIMIKDFNVSEKGHGSYWLLGILRWVMVLIFISFGIQKFTPPVRRRHCIIHFQQSVRFVAVYLRDQRRGLSARHYRADDGRSARCRRVYPDSIGTRLIDGNWYVCDYLVVFLLDTRCRQMERIHRPNSVEPHRGILVQRCRPSLCLYRVVFGITAKESRPASVELMSRMLLKKGPRRRADAKQSNRDKR